MRELQDEDKKIFAHLQSMIEAVLCSVAWIEAFVEDIDVAIRIQGKTGESRSPRFECS